ncbi:MAG: HAMP domain-containing sensor histidine kinase, partial [Dysosmobacter sp.]|nr:HAMP domain-containing sensor histidine kinase [Dysosmobacter sp.]
AKASYLSHNAAIATALFEQDIPSTVIAAALTSAEISEEGTALLAMAGVDATAESSLLPFHAQLQRTSIAAALGIAILLVIALLAGSWVFFSARKRLYCHADQAVSGYLCGDYSQHLPRSSEGAIYQIFAQVEQLATMLQAKTETEHQAKEFLKKSISDISHQLKTPLAALTMYQEIIADEPEHPDTVREFSDKMSVSLKRMEYLIQAMLKITRLDTGNIVFEKDCLNVAALVSQSIRELTTRAEHEHKQILVDGDAGQQLVCDRDWTCEAIGNIVKNALDHTGPGGTVRIHWEHTPAMLRIFITDNGSGIAPEDIHHIFKRFYRSKRSLDTQGIGLGLPLAKSIIEGQGGIIAVQSDPGTGTTFTLSFLTEL